MSRIFAAFVTPIHCAFGRVEVAFAVAGMGSLEI
jgi:hypothetical protein